VTNTARESLVKADYIAREPALLLSKPGRNNAEAAAIDGLSQKEMCFDFR
jgi:hypothetical protein